MPDPLSSNVVIQLRSDPTAALAAALILAGSFPDLVSWAMKAFGGKEGDSVRNGNATHAANCELKANGAGVSSSRSYATSCSSSPFAIPARPTIPKTFTSDFSRRSAARAPGTSPPGRLEALLKDEPG